MIDDHVLIDATEYLRSVGAQAERPALTAVELHAATPGNTLLLQSDRCRQLEPIVKELLASAAPSWWRSRCTCCDELGDHTESVRQGLLLDTLNCECAADPVLFPH
jgi:hypothetical protein